VSGYGPARAAALAIRAAWPRACERRDGAAAGVNFVINVNRLNLFCLSLIEAAQAGKSMLLHAVAGNRTLQKFEAFCVMLVDLELATIAAGLGPCSECWPRCSRSLGGASRACWEIQFTPAAIWGRHLRLYDTLTEPSSACGPAPQ